MSGLLDLAENFEKRSKEQAAAIEKDVQSAFQLHNGTIRNGLQQSERTLKSGLNDLSQKQSEAIEKVSQNAIDQTSLLAGKLRRAMKWLWLLIIIPALLIVALAYGATTYLARDLVEYQKEIKQAQSVLADLEKAGGKLNMIQCTYKGEDRQCIEVWSKRPVVFNTDNKTKHYVIPKGY